MSLVRIEKLRRKIKFLSFKEDEGIDFLDEYEKHVYKETAEEKYEPEFGIESKNSKQRKRQAFLFVPLNIHAS